MEGHSVTQAALRHHRERTITRLCDHFALDHLETRELEELIDRAHQATSLAALDELLVGLPELNSATAPVPAGEQPSLASGQQFVIALMGGTERKGAWTPGRNIYVTAVMGGAVLDFRDARLAPGITNVVAVAIMGGVEIIVPPGLRVESSGIGIMGGFEHATELGGAQDDGGPILRISGVAIWGGVEIKERPRKLLK